MKNTKIASKILESDVGTTVLSSNLSGRRPGQSRALDTRSLTLRLYHKPTGICVEGSVREGHYTRKQMVVWKEKLQMKLFPLLEKKVMQHLQRSKSSE